MPDGAHGLLEVTSPPNLPHLLSLSSQDLPRCFGKVFLRSFQLSPALSVFCPAYSACLWTCSPQTKPEFSLKLPSSSSLSLPLIDQHWAFIFLLFLAAKPRCWHISAMPCTCFSYSVSKPKQKLHELSVPTSVPPSGSDK